MRTLKNRLLAGSLALMVTAQAAHAQFAVIDVSAIAQLVQQVATLREQLTTAQQHLIQARDEYNSITGARGMELLLNGIQRNYLPPSWVELENALRGASGSYNALATSIRSITESNAVLSPERLAALSVQGRGLVEAGRQSAAMQQAVGRDALAVTSNRFASIQQLINAIPAARDQKAILDLQARIAAEQGMLQNEQTKLQVLNQVAQAEDLARQQRTREQAIADVGSLRRLPPMGLNARL